MCRVASPCPCLRPILETLYIPYACEFNFSFVGVFQRKTSNGKSLPSISSIPPLEFLDLRQSVLSSFFFLIIWSHSAFSSQEIIILFILNALFNVFVHLDEARRARELLDRGPNLPRGTRGPRLPQVRRPRPLQTLRRRLPIYGFIFEENGHWARCRVP